MQVLCGLQGIFLLFNCQTPASFIYVLLSLSLRFPAVKTGAGTKHTKKSVTPAYRKYKFYFAPPLSLKTCYTPVFDSY